MSQVDDIKFKKKLFSMVTFTNEKVRADQENVNGFWIDEAIVFDTIEELNEYYKNRYHN